jgi:hypothetical protein
MEVKNMKQNWRCSLCFQIFSRRWNLERHARLIHGGGGHRHNLETNLENNLYRKSRYNTPQRTGSSPGAKNNFGELFEFTEMLNKMSNSSQTFGRLNSLQWQVGSLQQQLANAQSQLNGVISANWLIPRESIQGLSGYICKLCQSFSLKPIFNIGYDMTMQSRHCCNEPASKRNYINFSLPSDNQNTDVWAAQILFDHINYRTPLSKFLVSKDLTRGFSNFSSIMSLDKVREIVFDIPHRYYSYSIESNHDINWIDRVINNLEKKISIKDNEARDFLKRVKSTYSIFEIPVGDIVKQVYIGFTDM